MRDTKKIAREFATRLRAEITPGELAEVTRRNATPEYGLGICASHDFCDANMPMAAAFEAATGRTVEPANEADAALWGRAWDVAKGAGFDPEKIGAA